MNRFQLKLCKFCLQLSSDFESSQNFVKKNNKTFCERGRGFFLYCCNAKGSPGNIMYVYLINSIKIHKQMLRLLGLFQYAFANLWTISWDYISWKHLFIKVLKFFFSFILSLFRNISRNNLIIKSTIWTLKLAFYFSEHSFVHCAMMNTRKLEFILCFCLFNYLEQITFIKVQRTSRGDIFYKM